MTREDFERYIAAFNANDFDGFTSFYADDVDFQLGDRMHIVGREAIGDFYRGVKAHFDEKLKILDLVIAEDGACLHVYTRFETIKDWPEFEMWPTKKGDVREIESIILYRIANGKFTHIKSARFKEL